MMSYLELGLGLIVVVLFILNVCQFLMRRSALHMAEILYVMTRHVREKVAGAQTDSRRYRNRRSPSVFYGHLCPKPFARPRPQVAARPRLGFDRQHAKNRR